VCHLASLYKSWFFEKPAYYVCVILKTTDGHISKYFENQQGSTKYPQYPTQYPTARAPWGPGVGYWGVVFSKDFENVPCWFSKYLEICPSVVFKITHIYIYIYIYVGFSKNHDL